MNMIQLQVAIEEVIAYLWEKEEADYKKCSPKDRKYHIFHSLVKLDNFINNTDMTADIHVGEE